VVFNSLKKNQGAIVEIINNSTDYEKVLKRASIEKLESYGVFHVIHTISYPIIFNF